MLIAIQVHRCRILFYILLMLILPSAMDSSRPRGPSSEHGELCEASWRPNLLEPLQRCASSNDSNDACAGKNNQQPGFSCAKSGFCCPGKEFVCTASIESGHENGTDQFRHFHRFAFSIELGACTGFSYFGTGGNFNNFLTFSECQHFCGDKASR